MKAFGYLDDLLEWFFNWQVSIGWWNVIVIPIEILIFMFIILKFKYRMTGYQ